MTRRPLLPKKQKEAALRHIRGILNTPLPEEDRSPILQAVRVARQRRDLLLRAAEHVGTPCYVLSEGDLVGQAHRVCEAFDTLDTRAEVFYAYKANDLPCLCQRLHREGIGAEVVSELELRLALELKCDRILFNGPAKSDDELRLAARHADRVWLHVDHSNEVKRIGRLKLRARQPIRVAVRIDPGPEIGGAWRKFGVPPETAVKVIRQILRTPGLKWEGLHGHLSWNTTPEPYAKLVRIFAHVIKSLSRNERRHLRYVDVGGGFYPPGEGVRLPELPAGQAALLAEAESGKRLTTRRVFFPKAADIDQYACRIDQAMKEDILSIAGVPPDVVVRLEPGRWLVNNAVGIVTTVVTKKGTNTVFVDGGIHLTHDGRMQGEYHAVANLSRPGRSARERACRVFGPMCDPLDCWGDTCWGSAPRVGDHLWIANMGAYGSSSSMRFLFPLAPYVLVTERGSVRRLTRRESFQHRYPGEWLTGTARRRP